MRVIDEEKVRNWLFQRAQEHQDRNKWDASFEDQYLVTALFRGDFTATPPEDPAVVKEMDDDTGLRYRVMREVPGNYPPYLAGTSNNKDLANAMCLYLCRQNPRCLAWVEADGKTPTDSDKRYWAKRAGDEQ